MASTKKLYKVQVLDEVHMVAARNQSEAIRHVVQQDVKVSLLTALEAAKLAGEGLEVEEAGAESPAQGDLLRAA